MLAELFIQNICRLARLAERHVRYFSCDALMQCSAILYCLTAATLQPQSPGQPGVILYCLIVISRGPAEVTAGLPLVQRSYLGALLPESLLHMLESYGPGMFAAALAGDHNTPEIIWTASMRQKRLIPAMLQVSEGGNTFLQTKRCT
jgi:hypothetical protein